MTAIIITSIYIYIIYIIHSCSVDNWNDFNIRNGEFFPCSVTCNISSSALYFGNNGRMQVTSYAAVTNIIKLQPTGNCSTLLTTDLINNDRSPSFIGQLAEVVSFRL